MAADDLLAEVHDGLWVEPALGPKPVGVRLHLRGDRVGAEGRRSEMSEGEPKGRRRQEAAPNPLDSVGTWSKKEALGGGVGATPKQVDAFEYGHFCAREKMGE